MTRLLLLAALLLPGAAAAQVVPGTTSMGFAHASPGDTTGYELCAAGQCEPIAVVDVGDERRFIAPAWLPASMSAVPLHIRAVWAHGVVDSPVVTYTTIQPPGPPGAPTIVEAGPPEPPEPPEPVEPLPVPEGAHGYFDALVASPWHWRSYSLRDPAQLAIPREGGFSHANDEARVPRVTYDPAHDPDPRRQDAAKVVVPARANNLRNQVRLPLGTGEAGFLLTWDAWYGAEWAWAATGIETQKTWQLSSAGRIWTEIRTRFRLAAIHQPEALGLVDVRRYLGSSEHTGAEVESVRYGGDSVAPQVATFGIAPETWTRYWVRLVPRGDGSGWWDFSLWVADETRAPVQVHDRAGIRPADATGWDQFWVEWNTSTSGQPEGRGDLVGYVRNVVLLHASSDTDMAALLVPPGAAR